MAEGGDEGVNGGVGEDFFGGSKSSQEWDDSPKTDDFGHSPYQHQQRQKGKLLSPAKGELRP
jgi:hypothetical protein